VVGSFAADPVESSAFGYSVSNSRLLDVKRHGLGAVSDTQTALEASIA
jgi:hypothetical protein